MPHAISVRKAEGRDYVTLFTYRVLNLFYVCGYSMAECGNVCEYFNYYFLPFDSSGRLIFQLCANAAAGEPAAYRSKHRSG